MTKTTETEEFTTKQTHNERKLVPALPDDVEMLRSVAADYANIGKGQYGATMFIKNVRKYLRNIVITEKQWRDVQRSWNTLHGVKTVTGSRKKTGNVTLATRFYERLSTAGLKQQCLAFSLDYSSFETQESIIQALVTKHVALMSV